MRLRTPSKGIMSGMRECKYVEVVDLKVLHETRLSAIQSPAGSEKPEYELTIQMHEYVMFKRKVQSAAMAVLASSFVSCSS